MFAGTLEATRLEQVPPRVDFAWKAAFKVRTDLVQKCQRVKMEEDYEK